MQPLQAFDEYLKNKDQAEHYFWKAVGWRKNCLKGANKVFPLLCKWLNSMEFFALGG